MATKAKAPIGSRWTDAKGRIWKVTGGNFGWLFIQREDRSVTGSIQQAALLTAFTRLD